MEDLHAPFLGAFLDHLESHVKESYTRVAKESAFSVIKILTPLTLYEVRVDSIWSACLRKWGAVTDIPLTRQN